MFDVAEQTASQVRDAVSASAQMQGGQEAIDSVLVKLREVRDQADQLDVRREKFQGVDEQLARMDALMIDVRSSMDTLQKERGFMDQVIETTGSLRFQAKHAEALIDTLREERELTRR